MNRFLLLIGLIISACNGLTVFPEEGLEIRKENNFSPKIYNEGDTLRVSTYNIRLGYGANNPFSCNCSGGAASNLDKLIEVIKQASPDILCLQEVAGEGNQTIIKDQISYIADKLKMNFAYADKSPLGINKYWGTAILTNFEIKETSNERIWYQNFYYQNNALLSVIKLNKSTTIQVSNCHLNGGLDRESQSYELNNFLHASENFSNSTKILAGDFNMNYRNSNLQEINEVFLQPLFEIPNDKAEGIIHIGTYPSKKSVIDHIFFEKQKANIIDANLIDSPEASDHNILTVSFIPKL